MLGVWFQVASVYFGTARTTPRTIRAAVVGNSLKATDRALEVLDLLKDLLDGRELLRGVTNGVLLLNGVRGLRNRVGACHRVGGRLLGAGSEKGGNADQRNRVISRHRCLPGRRSASAPSKKMPSSRRYRPGLPHSFHREDRLPATASAGLPPCGRRDRRFRHLPCPATVAG